MPPSAELAGPDEPGMGRYQPRVAIEARLRRAIPAPTAWCRGTVELSPGLLRWRPRRASCELGRRELALASVDLTRVRTTTVREVLRVDRSSTVFGLATPGELLELAVLPADLPAVRAALHSCRQAPL